ncbi:hypothetical protein K469DRAFT_689330 [Zopfia rhizophila CBS 207.26]|uniref:Uncharacterized protein n=1 Tax=Zopfia rhizophila CBS 207.26 TaxID=1314779 RepID=A0A6A6EWN1_9PEZI|nr:hypothetical protein K469DRAFT_689330 [Zopfia rhizophila CBS 207.26]
MLASVKVTLPVTLDAPQNSAAWRNLFGGGRNTLDFAPRVSTIVFNKMDVEAEVCAAVAFGPTLSLSLEHEDIPSMSMSLVTGSFEEAIKLTADFGVGLVLLDDIDTVGFDVAEFNLDDGDLYKKRTFHEKCYDISGDDDETPIINDHLHLLKIRQSLHRSQMA